MKIKLSNLKNSKRYKAISNRIGVVLTDVRRSVNPALLKARTFVAENPNVVRAICVLPLLITWFIGLHREEHRSAAYRGFIMSGLFLLSSWVLYWIIDLMRTYLTDGFVLQLLAFVLQGVLSFGYTGLSIRLAMNEYRKQDAGVAALDQMKERLLETI